MFEIFQRRYLTKSIILAAGIFISLLFAPSSLAADSYTVNSNLRHNPGVTASQLDGFIRGVYPSSPLVGLGQTWISAGAKYNIDPVYLMSHAILESGWGYSWISENKFNLYGWGAYDRDPEGMATPYGSFEAGIDYVASNINSMYLTPGGDYYTPFGPTLRGMNVHYATSKTWADSIAEIMNEFATGIPGYRYPPPFREYDATYSKIDLPSVMQPGTTQTAVIKVGNSGDAAWPAGGEFKLRLSMTDYSGKVVQTANIDMPSDVPSGQNTLISFPLTAPAAIGLYTLKFDMSRGGTIFYSAAGINPLTSGFSVIPLSLYYHAALRDLALPGTLFAGTLLDPSVEVINDSPSTWPDSVTSLGYQWLDLSSGQVVAAVPEAGLIAGRVFPGTTRTVVTNIRVPEQPGTYKFRASPVDSGSTWFFSNGSPGYSTIVDVSPDFAAEYSVIGDIEPLLAGSPRTIYVKVTNKSRMTWVSGGAARLAYSFSDSGAHVGYSAPLRLTQDVRPGETVTLAVELVPPVDPGSYTLSFDMFYKGQGWFSDFGVPVFKKPVTVGKDLRVSYDEAEIGTVSTGRYTSVRLKVTNTSKMVWPGGGRLCAGYRIGYMPGSFGFIRGVSLKNDVKPGESTVLEFTIADPPKAGVYLLSLDLYLEGAGWFSDCGNTTPSRLIVLTD